MLSVSINKNLNKEKYVECNGEREKCNEVIMTEMRNGVNGDFNGILQVVSALKQEDEELYNICLNYPNAPLEQEVYANFERQGYKIDDDFDGDGNLDVLINANDFGTEVTVGRYDAMNGLLLKGDGKGGFKPLTILESGIFIPGNGKALVKLSNKNGDYLIAASQNRGPLKLFQLKGNAKLIPVFANETSAVIEYKNGIKRKQEFYFGSSFLSQSNRSILKDDKIKSITIKDSKGSSRVIM